MVGPGGRAGRTPANDPHRRAPPPSRSVCSRHPAELSVSVFTSWNTQISQNVSFPQIKRTFKLFNIKYSEARLPLVPLQVKSGKTFLKDYYLKHRALSEKDLDDLVTKSSMSYEQVRDWFSETAKRVEEGKEPFSEEEVEGEDGEEEDEEEDEEEAGAAENPDSEGEMEVKEQGEEATDDDCNEEEEEEEEAELEEEEEVVEDDDTIQEESEGVSQSQPQAEEQT